MTFLNGVVNDPRLIIEDLNTKLVQYHLIPIDLYTHIGPKGELTLHSTSRLIKIAVAWQNAILLPRTVALEALP